MVTVMMNARELIHAYTANISDPDIASSLFAEDGVLELPYLESLGIPSRVEGPSDIQAFLSSLLERVPDLGFDKVEILIDTEDQIFGEWSVERTTVDGRPFSQDYAGRLVAENGKIKLLRESLDLVRAARAMLPNGVAGIPH
ncbi:nuclear transport factor 2 family protein [Streptomyces sp. NPDC005227]|uniref:nuclear transport factor 2 family protein n=1 Tax=Streptomyces sp. NPDC005227 TaxID=3364707 RepID=UPI0036B454C4